jgi:hypothetical protein
MALGMLIVIVSGNIDLSVGSVMGFIGALAAVMIVELGHVVSVTMITASWSGGGDRRGAGLLGRLLEDPVLHRDAGGHAGLSRAVAAGCWKASRSVRSRGIPGDRDRLRPDLPCRGAMPCKAMFGRARSMCWRFATGIVAAALIIWIGLRQRAQNKAYGIEDEPPLLHRPQRHRSGGADLPHLQAFHLPRAAQRADHHGRPDHDLRLHDRDARRSAGGSMRSAATRRRPSCRASRPNG